MNKLTDELLNKYIDNELDGITYKMVCDQLNVSEDGRKRLKALQLVHNELTKMEEDVVQQDFTHRIMERIVKKSKIKREQKIFIFSVSSVFVTITLGIFGYILYYILSTAPAEITAAQTGNIVSTIESYIHPVKNILKGNNLSIIGSIFSFGLLILVYLVFDTHKNSRCNLSNPH